MNELILPQLLEEYVKEKKKNELLVEQEQELRNQLSLYTEKFEEFQKTLTRFVFPFRIQKLNFWSKFALRMSFKRLSHYVCGWTLLHKLVRFKVN